MMSSKGDEELVWLATRYVLGELTVAERESFESRLADDAAACEAVTSASRLVLAAQRVTAARTLPASTTVRGSARGGWSVVAVAAAAVAVAGLLLVQTPREENSVVLQSTVATPNPAELVSLWRQGINSAAVEPYEIEMELSDDDVAVPGWMLAAVSLEVRGSLDPDALDGPANKVQEN